MAKKYQISVPKTARYFVEGQLGVATKELVIVLHGYSQSAEFFIRKFNSIVTEERAVVAPEGLHRFYRNGFSGNVGASWMTKVDREIDIGDYCNYLELLILKHTDQAPSSKITVIGFSQGAATAVRWLCRSQQKIARLVLWAGSFPLDVDLGENAQRLNALDLQILIGDSDQFIQSKDVADLEAILQKASVEYRVSSFVGDHDIYPEPLNALFPRSK